MEAMYPQYAAGTEDMYQITKNSLPGPVKYGLTKEQLRDSYFVQCVRLNMPDSEMTRQLSGLDTQLGLAQWLRKYNWHTNCGR